ncbi:hypothetical protein [Candidatus Thiodictyon syntrophicum]|jgi:hypothetical protein|nr:hypothetical protein [Candidatus Thiodictyon syntrophicum]
MLLPTPGVSAILDVAPQHSGGMCILRAETPLAAEQGWLRELTLWLTYEELPAADSNSLHNQDIWSCFEWRDFFCIARIGRWVAGDEHPSTRAHLRLWLREAIGPGCDPGVLIGQSGAFPLDDQAPANVTDEGTWPDSDTLTILRTRRRAAISLLACLLQAREEGRVLAVAAEPAQLRADADLQRLILVARAALPRTWKMSLRLRLFTLVPGLFIRRERAGLIAIPEHLARSALAADKSVFIADADGMPRFQQQLRPDVLAYSQALIEQTLTLPTGLLAYGNRCDWGNADQCTDWAAQTRNLPLCYRLAEGLRRDDQRNLEGLFRVVIFNAALADAAIPWEQLVSVAEWRRFPAAALGDFVLLEPSSLNPGARRLQSVLEQVLIEHGWQIDAAPQAVAPQRLLALAIHRPALIGAELRRKLVAGTDLDAIFGIAPPDALILSGVLGTFLAVHPSVGPAVVQNARAKAWLPTLLQSVGTGILDLSGWGSFYLSSADSEELLALAEDIAVRPEAAAAWCPFIGELVARLQSSATLDPRTLARVARRLITAVVPTLSPQTYLVLLDLLTAAEESADEVEPLGDCFARALEQADDESRPAMVDALLAASGRTMDARMLIGADGDLRIPLDPVIAARLLDQERLTETLSVVGLLGLLRALPESGDRAAQLVRFIDQRCESRMDETITGLIASGLWDFWIAHTQLDDQSRRQCAVAWLQAAVWDSATAPQPTLEGWRLALAVVREPGLDEGDLPRLRVDRPQRGSHGWPRVRCFEPEQIADLAGLCANAGALARLLELVEGAEMPFDLGDVAVFIAEHAAGQEIAGPMLRWLATGPSARQVPLTLDESALLLARCGRRRERALAARRRSLVSALMHAPKEVLALAEELPTEARMAWHHDLRRWVAARIQEPTACRPILETLEGADLPEANAASFPRRRAALRLAEQGFTHVAAFLDAGYEVDLAAEGTLAALVPRLPGAIGRRLDWSPIADLLQDTGAHDANTSIRRSLTTHPLRLLAARLADRRSPMPEEPLLLLEDLFRAAQQRPELLAPSHAQPGEAYPSEIAAVHMAAVLLPTLGIAGIGRLFLVSVPAPWRDDRGWIASLRGGLANALTGIPWRRACERMSVVDALLYAHATAWNPGAGPGLARSI